MAGKAVQDRLFLIALGVSSCLIIHFMRRRLTAYREASIIPPPESKSQYITQDVEDSLKLTTLSKLLDSPNESIRDSATHIIYERALYDATTIDILLHHIAQPDHATRDKGVRALDTIITLSNVGMMSSPKLYMAVVKSLEYSVTDYEHNKFDREWDNHYFRDSAEKGCLSILEKMTESHGPDGLVRARFIDRWLVKEPWGEDDAERQSNFITLLQRHSFQLNTICEALYYSDAGRKQLENASLVVPLSEDDINMVNGESTAGVILDEVVAAAVGGSSRRRERVSGAGEDSRRRHREAMVLNDGTTPLGRDDIFQREIT